MPRIDGYEMDYFIVTKQGTVEIPQAICFGPFRGVDRALGFADFETEQKDMLHIEMPICSDKCLTKEEEDTWLEYLTTSGFKHALFNVDRKTNRAQFDIKKVPMPETFIAMTAFRSLGEQPDAVSFFHQAVKLGVEKHIAFILSYLMVRKGESQAYKFGQLNGRDIHVPIMPSQFTKEDVEAMAKYPKPHRKVVKNRPLDAEPFIKSGTYRNLQKYTLGNQNGYRDGTWYQGHDDTTIDFSKKNAKDKLTQIIGALHGKENKAPERIGGRQYIIC